MFGVAYHMESRRSKKILVLMPLNVLLIILDIIGIVGIVVLSIIGAGQGFDIEFSIAASCVSAVTALLIFLTLETWQYVIINESTFELRDYRRIYKCILEEIKQIELRTYQRGARCIVVHLKNPIYRQNKKGKIYPICREELLFVDSSGLLKALKEYLPREKVMWVENKYCS